MQTNFIPLDYSYFDFEGKNYIKIYGRNEEGKSICLIDSFNPYFWAILKDKITKKEIDEIIEQAKSIQLDIKGRKTKVEKIELKEKEFLGKPVKALKIWGTNYKDLHDIADKLGIEEIEKRRGYDLGLMTNYIIEKKLKPLTWYKITGEILHQSNEFGGIDNILEVDFVIKLENKKELEKQTKYSPRILAYDIETDSLKPEEGETLMVSLRGKNFKKVISWKKAKTKKEYVEFVKNEKELIKKFTETVKKYSPDFLIGYNSDFFDLPFLKQRAKKVRTK